MREAIDKLMLDFNKFLEENAVFKGFVASSWRFLMSMPFLFLILQRGCRKSKRYEGDACQPTTVPGTTGEGTAVNNCISFQGLTHLQFSLHLNMAQESMSIFERDKLSLVANVEQVGCSSQISSCSDRLLELLNWSDCRR